MNRQGMTIDDLLRQEREQQIGRAQRDRVLREWMKPHIKRLSGTWVCVGRGVKATGLSPSAAYRVWMVLQDRQVMYAAQARRIPALQFRQGSKC